MGQARGRAARALGGWLPDSFALGWRKAERKHRPWGWLPDSFVLGALPGAFGSPACGPSVAAGPMRGRSAETTRSTAFPHAAPALRAIAARGLLRTLRRSPRREASTPSRRRHRACTEPAPAGPPRLRAVPRAPRWVRQSIWSVPAIPAAGRVAPQGPQAGRSGRAQRGPPRHGKAPERPLHREAKGGNPPRQGPGKASPSRSQVRQPARQGPGKASLSRSQGRQPARQGPGKASPSRSQVRPPCPVPAPARPLHREAIGDHSAKKKGAAPRGAAPLQALRLPVTSRSRS